MFKKILLITSFVAIFFCHAPLITHKIFAVTDSDSDSAASAFEKIWDAIISAIFPEQHTIKLDGTKESQISTLDSKEDFTDYTQQDKDWSQRTIKESLRKKLIGIWFNEVVSEKKIFEQPLYSDEVVAEAEGNCPGVNVSDIVYYYATKTDQKILYSRESSGPVDYPANIEHVNDIGPGSCYENAYRGIQSVPQGVFQGKGDAALSSTQLNSQLRYILPQSIQGDPTSNNVDTAENAESISGDNLKHIKIVRKTILTQRASDMTDCGNNLTDEQKMENLYKNMQKSVKPQKWIKEGITDDGASFKEYEAGIPITECSQGNGLSQYGAEGMALKGKTSEEILTAYYGIGNDYGSGVMAFGNIDTSATDKITVRLVENKNSSACDELANEYPNEIKISGDSNLSPLISDQLKQDANKAGIYRTLTLTVEDYLLGIGEIGLNWKLAAHKALIIAARTVAYNRSNNLTQSISDSKAVQVFLCDRLLTNRHLIDDNKPNVQIQAVGLTTGKVITKNGSIYNAQYLRCFGGPNTDGPLFNGLVYEKLAGVVDNQEFKGTCDDFVPLPNKTTKPSTTSTIGDLYIFPGAVHKGRIHEDYDLATTSESQYLQTYSGSCQLDSRIFPALNRLVADAQSAGLKVGFYSCYRTIEEQAALSADNPDTTTTALPGESAHHTGRAIDFANPINKISASSDLYKWLAANASKYGFYPYDKEAHHWEYNP